MFLKTKNPDLSDATLGSGFLFKGYYLYLLNAILQTSTDKKLIKPLAFYLLVRHRTNSIIYNYNPHKLSKITKLNYRTCQKYTDLLINAGLCEIHNGNLLFKNQYKLGSGYRYKLEQGTFKHIVNQLYFILLLNNKKQQRYNAGNKISRNKKVKKILTRSIEKDIFFSSRSIARTLSVSRSNGMNILKKLKFDKILSCEERLKFIKFIKWNEFSLFTKNIDNPFNYRFIKGCLYLHQGIVIAAIDRTKNTNKK